MNFKILSVVCVQLICTSLATISFTGQDIDLPTKTKEKYVDMEKYDKLIVNDTSPLMLKFTLVALNNINVKETKYLFNNEPIYFNSRPDVESDEAGPPDNRTFNLKFTKFTEKIAGQYELQIVIGDGSTIKATSNIFSPPILREFTESKRTTEGGQLNVPCEYTAHPQVSDLYWEEVRKQNNPQYRLMSSNVTTIKNVIVWDLLRKEDAGYYRCKAFNKNGNDTVILQLRVKDRLAPLWPFIGIVIELIILFAVILFYERRKANKKTTESADANPTRQSLLDDTKSSDINKDVRHRNTVD